MPLKKETWRLSKVYLQRMSFHTRMVAGSCERRRVCRLPDVSALRSLSLPSRHISGWAWSLPGLKQMATHPFFCHAMAFPLRSPRLMLRRRELTESCGL